MLLNRQFIYCITPLLFVSVSALAEDATTGSADSVATTTTSAVKPDVDTRIANQEQRIKEGIASGEITPKEGERLLNEQNRIKKLEDKMKEKGDLTDQDKMLLNKQLDKASGDIFRFKHNKKDMNSQGQGGPGGPGMGNKPSGAPGQGAQGGKGGPGMGNKPPGGPGMGRPPGGPMGKPPGGGPGAPGIPQ